MVRDVKSKTLEEMFSDYSLYRDDYSDDVIKFIMSMENDNRNKNIEYEKIGEVLNSLLTIEKLKLELLSTITKFLIDMKKDNSPKEVVYEKKEVPYDIKKDVPKFDISSFTSEDLLDKSKVEKVEENVESKAEEASKTSMPFSFGKPNVTDVEPSTDVWIPNISGDFIKPNRYKENQFKVEFPYGSANARFYLSGDDIRKAPDGSFDVHLNLANTYRFYQGVGNNKDNPDVSGEYLVGVLKDILS